MCRAAEPGRRRAGIDERLPDAFDRASAEDQFAAIFARVASAADDAAVTGDARLDAVIVFKLRERRFHQRLQPFDGPRPLNGDHGPIDSDVRHRDVRGCRDLGLDKVDNLCAVAGVDDHQPVRSGRRVRQAIDEHIVQNATIVAGDERVADLAGLLLGGATSDERIQKRASPRAVKSQATHVRDVKQPRRGARGRMLGDDRRVLHRHRPAREIDHSPAVRGVPTVQRRLGQGDCRHGAHFRGRGSNDATPAGATKARRAYRGLPRCQKPLILRGVSGSGGIVPACGQRAREGAAADSRSPMPGHPRFSPFSMWEWRNERRDGMAACSVVLLGRRRPR